jgi:hypothetical protein
MKASFPTKEVPLLIRTFDTLLRKNWSGSGDFRDQVSV